MSSPVQIPLSGPDANSIFGGLGSFDRNQGFLIMRWPWFENLQPKSNDIAPSRISSTIRAAALYTFSFQVVNSLQPQQSPAIYIQLGTGVRSINIPASSESFLVHRNSTLNPRAGRVGWRNSMGRGFTNVLSLSFELVSEIYC